MTKPEPREHQVTPACHSGFDIPSSFDIRAWSLSCDIRVDSCRFVVKKE
jgi:hypothetical protein